MTKMIWSNYGSYTPQEKTVAKLENLRSASVIGLGKMGLGYDLSEGKLLDTAKSHIGALRKIPEIYLINGVDLYFNNIPSELGLPSTHLIEFDAFASSPDYAYDLLVLATPTNSHYEVLQDLIEKHPFRAAIIEKPCGSSANECKIILDLLENRNIAWQVNYFRSALPHTLLALKFTQAMGLIPKRASINGYGDVLNIFSHFIHLMIKFSLFDSLLPINCLSLEDRAIISFESGFVLEVNNIGGPKLDLPILDLDMGAHRLIFKNNGQRIELIDENQQFTGKTFELPDFDNYQEYATKEYLKNLNSGISGDRRSVETVHEIVNAIISSNV